MPDAMNEAALEPPDDLDRRIADILRLEALLEDWDESRRGTVQALKTAIEELHGEGLRRLLRALKADPATAPALRSALSDPLVAGLLQFHGLLRASLAQRVARALDEVRPALASHGGDVELVALHPPQRIDLRLLGNCQGCAASTQTLRAGIEQALARHCPELTDVREVGAGAAVPGEPGLQVISPFAPAQPDPWTDLAAAQDIPEGGVLRCQLADRSLLLSRCQEQISCYQNACAHLGWSLDDGDVCDGVLRCRHHGLRYLLESGQCLDLDGVELQRYPVRIRAGRVQVRVGA